MVTLNTLLLACLIVAPVTVVATVAFIMLLGVYLGIKLDQWYPGRLSWTLTGVVVGMTLGCLNAWFWVTRESRGED